MKNSNYIYQARNYTKCIRSDGNFKVKESVYLKINDVPEIKRILDDGDYILSTIEKIIKTSDKKYKYFISFKVSNNNKSYKIWVDASNIEKKNAINLNGSQYKKGQMVSFFTWWGELIEDAKIIGVYERTIITKKYYYKVKPNNSNLIYDLTDEQILTGKLPAECEFKVGDKVIRKNRSTFSSLLFSNSTEIVKDVFTFEQNRNKVYLKINRNLTVASDIYTKCKDPLIIYSEVDPFGEEDWGD